MLPQLAVVMPLAPPLAPVPLGHPHIWYGDGDVLMPESGVAAVTALAIAVDAFWFHGCVAAYERAGLHRLLKLLLR